MAWLRLYDDILDDPKIQMLSDRAFRMLINLWCLAKRCGGRITSDEASLSFSLRMPVQKVRDTLQALVSAKLIERIDGGYTPHDWDQHQFVSDGRDTTGAERQRRYRANHPTRDKRDSNAVTQPLRNAHTTVLEPDTEPETEQIQKKEVVERARDPDDLPPSLDRVRPVLNRVCEILRVDLQADPSRITWQRQIEEMLRDGIPEADILAGAEVARVNAVLSLPYIRTVALKVRNIKETSTNGRPKRESIQDAWITTGRELAEEFAARDGPGDRHAPDGAGPKLLETGHGTGRSQSAVEAVLRGSFGKV